MDALPACDQLQLRVVDHVQWRYELMRPVVLLENRPATQRATETQTHPETVRHLARRLRQQGTLGLFPEHTEISTPSRGTPVPDTVVEELARLKALYHGFGYRALARILFHQTHYRIDDKTGKRLWEPSASPVQGALPFSAYHHPAARYQARLQGVNLYYHGWRKRSSSQFMQGSRPTVDRWMQRFEAEHCAGLEDKRRVPPTTPRQVWL